MAAFDAGHTVEIVDAHGCMMAVNWTKEKASADLSDETILDAD